MAVTNSYCTLADLKASLRITDGVDDAILENAIESASDLITGYANRSFLSSGSATRYFVPVDTRFVQIDDAQSVSEVKYSSHADGVYDATVTNYQTEPLNGRQDGIEWPITAIRLTEVSGIYTTFPIVDDRAVVSVTGVWGWPSVPRPIKYAAIIQASRLFKRADSPMGVISAPDMGFIRVGTKLDPDVAQLVEPYRLTRFYA